MNQLAWLVIAFVSLALQSAPADQVSLGSDGQGRGGGKDCSSDGFAAECLDSEEIRLQECKVDTWAACAWINLDPDARPLRQALSPIAGILDNFGVDNLRVYWWKEAVLRCNWKLAQEAFMEGWHVMATHPQLTMGLGEKYPTGFVQYNTYENGHALFHGRFDPKEGGVSTV